jgi:hypothetical protein
LLIQSLLSLHLVEASGEEVLIQKRNPISHSKGISPPSTFTIQ